MSEEVHSDPGSILVPSTKWPALTLSKSSRFGPPEDNPSANEWASIRAKRHDDTSTSVVCTTADGKEEKTLAHISIQGEKVTVNTPFGKTKARQIAQKAFYTSGDPIAKEHLRDAQEAIERTPL
jgi:hypothetical protein